MNWLVNSYCKCTKFDDECLHENIGFEVEALNIIDIFAHTLDTVKGKLCIVAKQTCEFLLLTMMFLLSPDYEDQLTLIFFLVLDYYTHAHWIGAIGHAGIQSCMRDYHHVEV